MRSAPTASTRHRRRISSSSSQDRSARRSYDRFGQLPANVQVLNTVPDYQQNPRKLVADQFKAAGQPRIVTVGFTEYNGLMIEFVGNLVAGTDIDVQQLATALAK